MAIEALTQIDPKVTGIGFLLFSILPWIYIIIKNPGRLVDNWKKSITTFAGLVGAILIIFGTQPNPVEYLLKNTALWIIGIIFASGLATIILENKLELN